MKNRMETLWALTVASVKMYFRNTTAVFFSLIFPIIFLVVFGFINTNDNIQLSIYYQNDSSTAIAQEFDAVVGDLTVDPESSEDQSTKLFKIDEDIQDLDQAKEKVTDGDLTAAIVVPADFGEIAAEGVVNGSVDIYIDESDQAIKQVVASVFEDILGQFNDEANKRITGRAPVAVFSSNLQAVQTEDLTAIDYLVPGIIAFSIMSLGVFSITEGFIQLKVNGSLRRLMVAPINPITFLSAQSITRWIMTIINVITMLILSVLLFSFTMNGSMFYFLLLATLGIFMFLGFGYAIAGWAKDGDQAAPLTNIVFFPMMFLSGTFFPREAFPEWLIPITEVLPLTFLADALRQVANFGASLSDVMPEIAGMLAWTVVIYFIAVRVFRWE